MAAFACQGKSRTLILQASVFTAVAGKLGALVVTFQKPRYGSGLISSLLLSTSKTIE